MLNFFTDPYEDELLYGTLSRYHYYSGNIDFKDTLVEIFGTNTAIPSLYFCGHIEHLAKNLGRYYTAEYIIKNHTLFNFYAPFMPYSRKRELFDIMRYSDGKGIYAKTGIMAGSICKKDRIYYCPVCAKEDIEKHKEPYIHRIHQLQGVFLCPYHGAKLKRYPIGKRNSSRVEFVRIEKDHLDFKEEYEKDKGIEEKLMRISRHADYIMKSDTEGVGISSIRKKYRELLSARGLASIGGSIRQTQLCEEFVNYWGEQLLVKMESKIDRDYEHNWLKVATRSSKRTVHPIRHIMIIDFLMKDIEAFFKLEELRNMPFGKGPWPCLNLAADHYKKDVVEDIEITADYKTRVPVGTFRCSCGFVYSRKGPDKKSEDRYKAGTIKEFGHVWNEKLKALLSENDLSIRSAAKEMRCDPKTIVKYDRLLGINRFESSNMNEKIYEKQPKQTDDGELAERYKKAILDAKNQNSGITRTELKSICKKEYSYLYRKDRKWLFENMPERKSVDEIDFKSDKRVDWEQRDEEILELLKQEYNRITQNPEYERLTISLLGRRLNVKSILEKKLDKIPKSKKFLNSILESVEEYQIRRVKTIIDNKKTAGEKIRLWEVQREAGLRSEDFEKVKKKLGL